MCFADLGSQEIRKHIAPDILIGIQKAPGMATLGGCYTRHFLLFRLIDSRNYTTASMISFSPMII